MKFHSGLITYIFLALILINPAYSDVEKGKELSASCAACHGDDGISLNPVWPKLAGQNPKYLASQLHEFKKGPDGNRNNAVMYGIAVNLSDQDIEDLSEYYSSLKSTVGLTKDEYLELGRNIYRGGNMEIKMQACISCHGPNGQGNYAAAIPMLSGQHSQYTYQQLKNFQTSIRSNDYNKMMRNIVHRMTDEEMKAVASYIEGLY
ncbi:MAG: cytochrome c4 [Gammaproteobacteria bacterium]|jgi:cytochrome c553|nr:cytochrome c4 [Gammaproteobacteria bacterium]